MSNGRVKTFWAAVLAVCVLVPTASAEVRLANIIGPNMVLQREMPVPIWGWAVVVSSDKVPAPVAVRYAYSMNPDGCNLYNV